MAGLAWWVWAAAAALVAVAELHAPGSYLVWIALGGAVTAATVAAGGVASLEQQVGCFVVASAASCVLGWFVYRALPGRRGTESTLNQRSSQLIGATAIVSEPFVNGEGKVRLGDSLWLAKGPALPTGAAAVVIAVEGTRLVVREADG